MNDSFKRAAQPAIAAVLLGLVAGCTSLPPLPRALAPSADEALAMTVAAEGVQIYECRPGAGAGWAFVAPDAELFGRNGRHIGHHGAGPHWQANDGSRVKGRVRASAPAANADAIPWLLLSAQPSGGRGVFSQVTSIQRLNTHGGLAPATPCHADARGTVVRVPYRADYRLFVAWARANPSYAPF